jgi:hypothetical protein
VTGASIRLISVGTARTTPAPGMLSKADQKLDSVKMTDE